LGIGGGGPGGGGAAPHGSAQPVAVKVTLVGAT
jgi:hypothetical protein